MSTGGTTHLRTRGTSPSTAQASVSTKGPSAMPQSTAEVPPCFLSQGLQELGGESPGLKLVSTGHRSEEVQAARGVKLR